MKISYERDICLKGVEVPQKFTAWWCETWDVPTDKRNEGVDGVDTSMV